ncbi:MAG: c-type cytochrome biogenesis protein CcsB, partial [Comamonas sp.]
MSSTTTSTITLNEGYFARRNWADWLFAAMAVLSGAWALHHYGHGMDVYEKGILIGTVPSLIALGWFWRPLSKLMLAVGVLSLL